jgi:hypothetical protein
VNAHTDEGILFVVGSSDLLGVMSHFTVIHYIKGRSFVREILESLCE